jgi:hypothetical protein
MWSDALRFAALLRIQTSSALAAGFDPSPDCAFNFGIFRARRQDGTQFTIGPVSPLLSRTPHQPLAGKVPLLARESFVTQASGHYEGLRAHWHAAKGRRNVFLSASRVVKFVQVAHRLHDRLEVRPRVKRVEQLGRILQQSVRTRNRDPDIVLRGVGQPAVAGQQ